MRILVAEDDAVTRKIVDVTLERLGWDVITAEDGNAAWRHFETLKGDNAPELAVLDWMMPGLEGIEICRRLRATPGFELVYVILLTSRGDKEDLSAGLAAGANDYITKPFDTIELEARVRVGERMVRLQTSLTSRITELENALAHVRRLQGLLPICSYCKKVRNETNYWQQVESYLTSYTGVELTHSVCPSCFESVMKEIDEAPITAPVVDDSDAKNKSPSMRGLSVLIADDNAVNQKLAAAIIGHAGHQVSVVGNGRDAVAAIARERFDVVLMDIEMPEMGGLEASRHIREMEAPTGRRTPIVAVTARTVKGGREECLAAGMDGYLPKPVQAKKLLRLIEQLVGGQSEGENGRPGDRDSILDEPALMATVGGSRQLAGELAGIYLDDLEPRMRELTSAIREKDAERLRFAAHALRGSSASMSAVSVAALAGSLESIGLSGELDQAEGTFAQLQHEMKGLRERLAILKRRA